MAKIGLALSGGGFRATLYHLGVIRFLRDAGVLKNISHITAVSGGSILAAYMVLNWSKFNGSEADFDEAATKLLDFIRLDVRNRIVRRYPFAVAGNAFRWLTRRPQNRMLTRSGLLERCYSDYLFGDTCLYELPKAPELHLLSTNLSEGCLCSFTRDGLIMQRRLPGDQLEFERIAAGLATVSLAVAASSAFPGFFPPISINAADIGASELAFIRQSFTDGGVFDNLGVRAFRFIERCWGEECKWGEPALREVQTEKLTGVDAGRLPSGAGVATNPGAAREICQSQNECDIDGNAEGDSGPTASAEPGANDGDSDQAGDGDKSREFHEEFGRTAQLPAAPPTSEGFDVIITSDAGGKFMVNRRGGGGGLIRTAMRSSDILMDRVWQLEKEIVGAAPGFLFVPIAQVVELDEDPYALAPVVQRQVTSIRTDLDRFSAVEISSLVQHGYCVARRACQLRPDVFAEVPQSPPWNPMLEQPKHGGRIVATARTLVHRLPASPTQVARKLQRSAERRVWSTLADVRDLMTYAFIPLLVVAVTALPYLAWKCFSDTTSQHSVLKAFAETDPDQRELIDLLRNGTPDAIVGLPFSEGALHEEAVASGIVILSDFHIVDLRAASSEESWIPFVDHTQRIYEYRRLHVRRAEDPTAIPLLSFQYTTSASMSVAVVEANLRPRLKRRQNRGSDAARWQLDFDLSNVEPGEAFSVTIRRLLANPPNAPRLAAANAEHHSLGETHLAKVWLLLPEAEPNRKLELVVTPSKPGEAKDSLRTVTPDRQFHARSGAMVGWQLHELPPGRYESRWRWD